MTLLRGTHAAIRCRQCIDAASWPDARLELSTLQECLLELRDLLLDAETAQEVERLRELEAKLRRLFAPAVEPGASEPPGS